jgi:hypothetical protein
MRVIWHRMMSSAHLKGWKISLLTGILPVDPTWRIP